MRSRKLRGSRKVTTTTAAEDSARRFKLEFLESALREWHALDGSVKYVFKKQLASRLNNPHFPGSELHGPLAGCYKIKLRAQGYRLVYQVRDDVLVVLVIAIDRRDKDKIYQSALKRIESLIKDVQPQSSSAQRRRSTS